MLSLISGLIHANVVYVGVITITDKMELVDSIRLLIVL
jgi:hypothetical protein